MDAFDEPDEQAQATREAMNDAGLQLSAVWMRYFSFTGAAGEYEVDAYLNGSMELPVHERDLLAHAVNELINELPPPRKAPYSANETNASNGHGPSREDEAAQDRK